MTAPLTPPEPPNSESSSSGGSQAGRPPRDSADASYDGLPAHGAGGASRAPYETTPERGRLRTEILRGVLVAAAVAVCGVILGLLWLWLSPRVPMVSDGQAVYLKDTEGEEAVGGDGVFVLIALALGALTAAAVFWRYRRGGVAVVLGLAVGGVVASVIGWRIGVWLGPTTDIVAHAKQVGPKVVFDGPLKLRAKSALVAWSAAATLVHTALNYAFGPRDEPSAGAWTDSGFDPGDPSAALPRAQ